MNIDVDLLACRVDIWKFYEMIKSGRYPRQSIKAVADSDWLKEAEPSTLANWWGVGGVVRQLGTKRRLMKLLVLPRRSMRGRANDTYILQSSGRPCVATDMTPHYATTPIPTPLCAESQLNMRLVAVVAKSGATHYVFRRGIRSGLPTN